MVSEIVVRELEGLAETAKADSIVVDGESIMLGLQLIDNPDLQHVDYKIVLGLEELAVVSDIQNLIGVAGRPFESVKAFEVQDFAQLQMVVEYNMLESDR